MKYLILSLKNDKKFQIQVLIPFIFLLISGEIRYKSYITDTKNMLTENSAESLIPIFKFLEEYSFECYMTFLISLLIHIIFSFLAIFGAFLVSTRFCNEELLMIIKEV